MWSRSCLHDADFQPASSQWLTNCFIATLCRTWSSCLGPNRLLGVQLIALYVLISLAYYFK